MSRHLYRNFNKNSIQDIINNLKINSLDEIDILTNKDIDFLIENTNKTELHNIIDNTEKLYNRSLYPNEIRNIKISYLFENILYKLINNTETNNNIKRTNKTKLPRQYHFS